MELQKYDWSAVLSGVGKIATVFNPAIGGGLIVASEVVNKFTQDSTLSNDAVLENDVIGLTRCAEILESNLQKFELTSTVDFEQLKLVAYNLRSLQTLMIKTSAIMK